MFPQQTSHEPEAKVGDLVTAVGDSPKPEDTDESDKEKSRSQRLGRMMVRSAETLESQGKEHAAPAAKMVQSGYNPQGPGGTTQETVEVPRATPTVSSGSQDFQPTDAVGTGIVLGVVAVEGIARLVKRKAGKDGK